jgi:tRNA-intron endonuclease
LARFKALCETDEGGVRLVECVDRGFCASLAKSGYVRDPGYLEALEAAYQASIGAIVVDGETGWSKALDLVYRFSGNLALFIVYFDLRSRGRRVLRGLRRDTLIVKTGRESLEVLVLEEGSEVRLEWLAEWAKAASGDGFGPVVAIVDRNGDVTYYEVRASLEIG